MMINGLVLNIDSDTFEKMKIDFNETLRRTLFTMRNHGSGAATITVKLSVSLEDAFASDKAVTQYEAEREIVIPAFAHKVTSVIQIKDEKSGIAGGRGYELVFDDNTKQFYMVETKDIKEQISMFTDLEGKE